jgi:hypothetical protein
MIPGVVNHSICGKFPFLDILIIWPSQCLGQKYNIVQLAWPLHKDDTLFQSGRSMAQYLFIYASILLPGFCVCSLSKTTHSLQVVIVFYFAYNTKTKSHYKKKEARSKPS